MPTYEYRCPEGHHFELFQRISEEPAATCPECGAAAERVLSGGAGFLFRGEGFYITDYRSEEYRKRASAEAKAAESGGSGEKVADAPPKGDGGGTGGAAGTGTEEARSPARSEKRSASGGGALTSGESGGSSPTSAD